MKAVVVLFGACTLWLVAQQAPPPQQKQAQPKAAPKAEPKAGAKEPAKSPAEEAAKPATPQPPAPPRERRETNYVYDLQGRPVASNPGVREERKGTGAGSTVERVETLRDHEGRPIQSRAAREQVLTDTEENRTTERVVQRYDPTGRPTTKQTVRSERRKTADGTVVTTETTYEQDLNGRMRLAERRSTSERKTAAGGSSTVLVERLAINGGVQVVERVDKIETKRSESVTESVSSRKFLDGNGRFEEREREASVATRSGEITQTESRQFLLGASGQMDLVGRSSSRLQEMPDGSQVEDVEVYTTRIAGSTFDLNRPNVPTLEQQVRREKKVAPGGKIVETTSTRHREVVDPTRLSGLTVEENLTTPTADGQTVHKTRYERDSNGKMLKVQSSVEEQKK